MTEEILDEMNDEDYFNDADLSEPTLLPAGKRYIGKVSKVDTSATEPGKLRKVRVAGGERQVKVISVGVTALKFATGAILPADQNYRTNGRIDFWVSKEDSIGRHSLSNLIRRIAGLEDADLIGVALKDAASHYLPGGYITFEVSHRQAKIQGVDTTVQDFKGIKVATSEEKGFVVG